jgi:small subunit ribosomal protein S15
MSVTKERKDEIFTTHGGSSANTGNTEGQIALFTERINHLTGHLKENKKDVATQKSLIAMVGKRRSLLNYLKHKDIERYRAVIKELNLRK